ncbi:baseplate J/gp47 family protein [Providencia sp. PROV117]|uniref:baseplate J/gp47 family protein n=1 Tax=Providencia sp. PROV117 TaxID=2949828 RepID=UPI00234AE08D|nr:baseplate J/gp47 family protein [Providencia sp. PROV117]
MIPKLEITQQGIIAPTTQEVIDGLWSLMKGAFGDKLNVSMDTPQGQLVTTLAAIITDERNQLIELFNQFDPRYADGQMQDAIGYLYFLQRKQATKSVAELTFNGLSGVTIPTGFQILDEAGLYWSTTGESRIGTNGLATVNASCNTAGMVSAQPNTINRIVINISGLDSVTNNAAAVIGRNAESRQEFELRREQSVAKNAKNMNSSTYGAVSNINDVIDCYVVDNPSDATIKVGKTNYSLIRNSIAVSVVGGDDNEIAKQILTKAGTGCAFVGNTAVTYEDIENFPYMPPKYEIKFIRPTHIPVEFTVLFEDKNLLTFQEKEAVKNAILDEFKAGRGKGQIAKRLIASDYICTVAQSTINRLLSIQVSRKGNASENYIDFGIDEFPVLSAEDIRIM